MISGRFFQNNEGFRIKGCDLYSLVRIPDKSVKAADFDLKRITQPFDKSEPTRYGAGQVRGQTPRVSAYGNFLEMSSEMCRQKTNSNTAVTQP